MTALNAGARDAANEIGVHAATDVTGFGLLGHLRELCVGSGVGAVVAHAAVPVIDGARDLLAAGVVAGGTQRNHAFVAPDVDFHGLDTDEQLLLCDAQTSGGLLLALPEGDAPALVAALQAHGTLAAAVIGHTTPASAGAATIAID
jgi:selenide,water dikinase